MILSSTSPYDLLKEFSIAWTPFFAFVQIIYFLDCLRIYTFIISDPLTSFRKWKLPNFGREKGFPPLQQ